MNPIRLLWLTCSLVCLTMVFSACGKSDAEEVVDCYEEHLTESTLTAYSDAIQAWSLDPTNMELCEEANTALSNWLMQLADYAKCARDNGVALQAGFENIDQQIEDLENSEDDFEC